MVTWVQTHPEHTARSIYHQGLIKLLVISHLNKDGQSWESFLLGLGFEEKVKEKGKRAESSYKKIGDLNQQAEKHVEQTEQIAEEGKDFIEELKVANGLFLEALATYETIVKQVKEYLKNLDSLSIVINNANLKEEE